MLDFIGRSKRWNVWEGAQAVFESLDLINEGIEKEILGLENFEGQKECCEAEFVKELDLNEQESKLAFQTIVLLEFESVEETQKLETDTAWKVYHAI